MSERRSLVTGLDETPELRAKEEKFVFGDEAAKPETPLKEVSKEAEPQQQKILPQMEGRVPVTIRCRPEIASSVKRVALKRQLDGIEPFRMQDILEQALENWLRDHA